MLKDVLGTAFHAVLVIGLLLEFQPFAQLEVRGRA